MLRWLGGGRIYQPVRRRRGAILFTAATSWVSHGRYLHFIPPIAPEVTTQSQEYVLLARELSLLSVGDFAHRVYHFSRTNFDVAQRPSVHAHLQELLQHRMRDMTAKVVQDYAHLAHVAGFHKLCLGIYYRRRQVEDRGNGGGVATNPGFGCISVSEHIVDSAFALHASEELLRLAMHCASRLQACAQGAGFQRDVVAEFCLVRALWRCACLAEFHQQRKVQGGPSYSTDAQRALSDAFTIYDECVQKLSGKGVPDLAYNAERFVRTISRFIKYDSSGDDGEMLLYQLCVKVGILQVPPQKQTVGALLRDDDVREQESSLIVADTEYLPRSGALPVTEISDTELFYAALISSCVRGGHSGTAMSYLDAARKCCGHGPLMYEGDQMRSQTAEAEVPCTVANEGKARTQDDGVQGRLSVLSEYAVYKLLGVLQATRDNQRIVQLARSLMREGGDISISVWSLLLISAGELRASDVALEAYRRAKAALVRERDGGVSPGSGERRGLEYLLQTALNALSKCQIPHFERDYLAPASTDGLLHCTQEFYFCCILQDAHNSTSPIERAEAARLIMEERCVPWTTPIVTRLLKLYLRVESPLFLEVYRHAVHSLGLFRAPWMDELLLWADRRRYFLSQSDRAFIIEEVRQVKGSNHSEKALRDALGGLRTQYALLEYDYTTQPCSVFLSTQSPPKAEPTMVDSRMHFLLKKPQSVMQGLFAGALQVSDGQQSTPVCGFAHLLIGDPQRRTEVCNQVFLLGAVPLQSPSVGGTATSDLADQACRIYLSDMLEGLQRSHNYAA